MAIDPKAFGLELAGGAGPDAKPYEEKDGLAILRIEGPLMSGPHFFWQDYQSIEKAAGAAFKSKARAVALCIDSPGGMASGCFELARALRGLSEATRKPLGVFVTGQACSAAYAIACAATAGIWAPPTSIVGNVAVFEALVDATAADAQMGFKFAFIVSEGADLKLAGNPHVPLSEAVVEHTQAQVDILTGLFDQTLSEMRGLSPETTRAMRGAAWLASQGVEKGLVDGVGTYGAFLAALQKGNTMPPTKTPEAKASKATEEEWSALRTLAESDDEEKRKMAKKMLATMMGENEDTDGDGDAGKDTDKDGARKAEGKDEEDGKKAARPAAGPQATASSDVVAMAQRLHAIEVERAAEKDAAKRAELLAKRPDFSAEVRATLASASLEVLEKAVATWPRVTVTPAAAASAATPGVTPGEFDNVRKGLSPVEQQLLDRLGRSKTPTAKAARSEGTQFVLDPMTPEAAAARMKQMTEQGTAPKGRQDFERISNTEFKTPAK